LERQERQDRRTLPAHQVTPAHPTTQAELHADIAATRAELWETLAALAAKTQVKTHVKEAARNSVANLKDRSAAFSSQLRAQTGSHRSQLSVAAVAAGGLTALTAVLAAIRSGKKTTTRSTTRSQARKKAAVRSRKKKGRR